MLSFILWFPLLMALLLFVIPIQKPHCAKGIALFSALVPFMAAFYVFCHTPTNHLPFAFEVKCKWVPHLGISYHLGVNHFNAMLILLATLVGVVAVGVSEVKEKTRHFYALALLMIGGIVGAFVSLDLFFFYIFHEFALIPTFILIGLWGAEKRQEAAMKITLYLSIGSLILLLGFIGIYWSAGGMTFDLPTLREKLAMAPINPRIQIPLFGILFLGFGILISVFPFHTWAPIGYGEAPPLAAMLHAGVIKKFGLYGLIVVAIPLLPAGFEYWRPWIVTLAVGNLIYCGYVAMQQDDLRYMLAYSSVSHMGYALLALAAATQIAIQGFILFLFAHGLSVALGFGIVGHCREQINSSLLSELGGLARRMPVAATFFTITALASCALPGFANFPAELLIFFGSFDRYPWITTAALWAALISAVYLIRAIRSTFLGTMMKTETSLQDIGLNRRIAFALLVAASLLVGFWPRIIVQSSPQNTFACAWKP